MPQLDAIISVTLAGLALSATPGPSMLYVLSHSVGQSRAAGLASAVGLGLGGVILAVATALGLAALLTRHDWLLTGLSYVGSAYLIWLGIGMIREARSDEQTAFEAEKLSQRSLSSIVWRGMLVELLNPKTLLFFALFLPPFVSEVSWDGTDANLQLQLLTLGAIVPLTALPSDLIVAYLGGTMAQAINRRRVIRECLGWIGGLILVFIALNLQFSFI